MVPTARDLAPSTSRLACALVRRSYPALGNPCVDNKRPTQTRTDGTGWPMPGSTDVMSGGIRHGGDVRWQCAPAAGLLHAPMGEIVPFALQGGGHVPHMSIGRKRDAWGQRGDRGPLRRRSTSNTTSKRIATPGYRSSWTPFVDRGNPETARTRHGHRPGRPI